MDVTRGVTELGKDKDLSLRQPWGSLFRRAEGTLKGFDERLDLAVLFFAWKLLDQGTDQIAVVRNRSTDLVKIVELGVRQRRHLAKCRLPRVLELGVVVGLFCFISIRAGRLLE